MARKIRPVPAGYDNRRPHIPNSQTPQLRLAMLKTFIHLAKVAQGERARANIKKIGEKVYRGDMHMHTNYSDGGGTVADNKETADLVGLDFIFVTDHKTIHQRKECRKLTRCWAGQEPAGPDHHLGLLGLRETFVLGNNYIAEYRRAIKLGIFPFVAHPCGWFPTRHYTKRQIDMVADIGDDLTIELINGAVQIIDAWDVTDARTVKLWDHLLSLGKTVRVIGNSDAHIPEAVGCAWNAVFTPRCTEKGVIAALWKGHNYLSEAPALSFRTYGIMMGGRIKPHGSSVRFNIAAADVDGLREVRLVTRNGKVAKHWQLDDQIDFKTTHTQRITNRSLYFRLEVEAFDGKKAFSNPIYIV